MSIFVILMIAGLVGLALMALPGFARHGHAGAAPHGLGHAGHGVVHIGHGASHVPSGHAVASSATPGAQGGASSGPARGNTGPFWLTPSPRVLFSLMTLFGAFGYALVEAAHLAPMVAGLLAVIPALLIERFAVTPLWNLLFQFQGTPCAPLQELVLGEATAVTPFRNGRGLVSVVHDGRLVQLRAELVASQKAMPVRVGDTLLIEEVDAEHERMTVSMR
ncbi:MAG TPA: hypothetical protein VKT52_00400 [Ktedonobacterales bacterium]|nr:hypothetical protein [Ktedonobacterales bacterium]